MGEGFFCTFYFAELDQTSTHLQDIETLGLAPINPVAEIEEELNRHRSEWEELFKGGEEAGLARLEYYVWQTNLVARYKKTEMVW